MPVQAVQAQEAPPPLPDIGIPPAELQAHLDAMGGEVVMG